MTEIGRRHQPVPRIAALELTLRCPCRCITCGSDAGRPRASELDTAEWMNTIAQLADLGCERITLMGGEPLVFEQWQVLARAATQRKIAVDMVTSGLTVDATSAAQLFDAGLVSVSVSIDGTKDVHERLRGVRGSYSRALRAIELLDRAGLRVGVNTQVNAANLPTLEPLAPILEAAGVLGWQLQLTLPVGRAIELQHVITPPDLMPALHATLTRLSTRAGLRPFITDNLGYCTTDDSRLRTPQGCLQRSWRGCSAGLQVIGITSDGRVKGCLAMPDSAVEGSLRDEPLASIWNDSSRFAYTRRFTSTQLTGACADCPHGLLCRGGCTATAMAIHGRPGRSSHCFRLHGIG